MYEHAAVAAHFASASTGLLEELTELHKLGTRRLTLVDVLRSHHSDAQDDAHRKEARRRLEEEKTVLEGAGFEVNIELRTGQPAYELSAIARARQADLILVGSRGESRFREFLRGSTVLQLIRKSTTPTLIEPIGDRPRVSGRGFRSVLLGTDFSDSCFEAERHAAELAGHAEKIVLCHVLEQEVIEDVGATLARDQAEGRLQALAEQYGAAQDRVVTRLEEGTPSRVLRDVAEEEGSTMLIVGKRGRSPIRELMLGSTTENVVRRTSQSVLMVPRSSLI